MDLLNMVYVPVNFASIRIRKGKSKPLLYVGIHDELWSMFLPVSSVKNYHILGTIQKPNVLLIPIAIVDENNVAHALIYGVTKNKLRFLDHISFDNVKCKRFFILGGKEKQLDADHQYFCYVGEDEDSRLHIKSVKYRVKDFINAKGMSRSSDFDSLIEDIQKGSIRPIYSSTLSRNALFYLTKEGKMQLYTGNNCWEIKPKTQVDSSFTSLSEEIDVNMSDVVVIPSDAKLYLGSETIEHSVNYPCDVQNIRKIGVLGYGHEIPDIDDIYTWFVLTKDGKLWGRGSNIFGMLGNYHKGEGWKIVFDNVEEFYLLDSSILIKTIDGNLYQRGNDERDMMSLVPFFPSINRNIFPKTNLIAKNIDTYIGTTARVIPKVYVEIEKWLSFFLNEKGEYIRGVANYGNRRNDSIQIWAGDLRKMEDVFFDSVKYPNFLLKYAC